MSISRIRNTPLRRAACVGALPLYAVLTLLHGALVGALDIWEDLRNLPGAFANAWRGRP